MSVKNFGMNTEWRDFWDDGMRSRMTFLVMNREDAGRYVADDPHVMISVRDPKSEMPKFPDNDKRIDVLPLCFYDVDTASLSPALLDGVETPYFMPSMAKAVLDFFEKHRNNVNRVLVHCEAGISRSAAIAAALSKIENHTDHFFFRKYLPNRRVYSLILAEFYRRTSPEDAAIA